jgi:hypothetical protein
MELVTILRENVTISGDYLNNYINEKNSSFLKNNRRVYNNVYDDNNDNNDNDDNDDIIY